MDKLKSILTAVIFILLITLSIIGVLAQEQIRPAPQTEGRGVGEQIRPANQQSLPSDGNGNYHPSEGSSYSSSEHSSPPPVSDTVRLTSNINGSNINSSSNSTGSASFVLNKTSDTLSFDINYNDFSSNVTGSEIIIPDLMINNSNNSTVPYSIDLGVLKSGIVSFLEQAKSYILEGKAILKIRSILFPDGEIGGSIRII
jgi:hypothetical protein